MKRLGRALKGTAQAVGVALFMLALAGLIVRGMDVFAQPTPTGDNTSPSGTTFGGTIGPLGIATALDISGLAQPWYGLTAGGINLGAVVVYDPNGNPLAGYTPGTFGAPSSQVLSVQNNDPCSYAVKQSAAINITSATTTGLVAASGTTAIYVCGYDFTVSEVITTANTLQLEAGTGAACVTTQTAKTGLYGGGGVTAGSPIHIVSPATNGTVFSTPASGVLCAVTVIGATGSFQGVLTYVQQ